MGGKKKRAAVWILAAAVLVAAVLGYCLLGGRGSGSKSSVTAACQVGQVVEAGGMQFTVVRSYESNGTDSERPRLQYVYTIARVSLTNKTAQPVAVKPGDFTLSVDDREIPLKPMSYVLDSLAETNLQPGAAVEGALSWETPTRYRHKFLVYHGPAGKSTTVDLLKKAE